MQVKNKVLIKINGQEYPIVGAEPKEYLLKVGSFVDDRMEEVARANKRLSTSMIAVLTSINIADQYLKQKDEIELLQQQYTVPLNKLEKIKAELEITQKRLEETEYFGLQQDEQLNELRQFKENHEKETISLKNRLQEKENDLQKAEEIINDLQNKLFENQLKLVEARKQLEGYIETSEKGKYKNK
ncbi:cell division protein ZapA [Alkaliphilus peptidifermentans]|uniref:Cell division protein ZapA n=1 Tax=Alkaliphilus peptidifermentans DSM 18978 TaxID=1120976 RepID=A0A1G5IX36_9FIRM|nr:cell division protein ZapA [Alkaliphilus peptidifermentans]SCY80189.1 cell division protein ZapA [Alkaliphilus peptidifermentans DSM 18978]